MILGDLGADVIKIEQPQIGDYARSAPPLLGDTGSAFLMLNRNKRSITLDLKKAEAQEILRKLAARADVLVESYRPGVADGLGVGYQTVSQVNARIVYCSISGFGQDGPYRDLVGHDLTYMAYSGAIGGTGPRGGPPVIPAIQVSDIQAAMYSAIAIMAALYGREKTGKGDFIDISLMDAAVASMILPISFHFAGESTERGSSLLSGGAPFYNIYETADRKYVAISALEPKFWIELCSVLGLEKYQDKQLASVEEKERIRDDLAAIFHLKTRDEWVKILNEREIPCAPIYDVSEALADPHVMSRKTIFDTETEAFGKLKQLATPIRMSNSLLTARLPPPRLGEHTLQVLQELGYSPSEMKRLRSAGAI